MSTLCFVQSSSSILYAIDATFKALAMSLNCILRVHLYNIYFVLNHVLFMCIEYTFHSMDNNLKYLFLAPAIIFDVFNNLKQLNLEVVMGIKGLSPNTLFQLDFPKHTKPITKFILSFNMKYFSSCLLANILRKFIILKTNKR